MAYQRSPKYLKYVRDNYPCAVCGTDQDIQAHHITYAEPRALGRKNSDRYVVPICPLHHYELHQLGEKSYWKNKGLEPLIYANLLWDKYQAKVRTVKKPLTW